MQSVFQYDYGLERDAHKQAKKCAQTWDFVWTIRHPKTGRYKVILGDGPEDEPSRVPFIRAYITPPRPAAPITPAELWEELLQLVSDGQLVIALANDGRTMNHNDLTELVTSEVRSK